MSIIKRKVLELDLVSLYKDLIEISLNQSQIHSRLIAYNPKMFVDVCEMSINTGRQTGRTTAIKELLDKDDRNIFVVCNKSFISHVYGQHNSSKVLTVDRILNGNYHGVKHHNAIYIFDDVSFEDRLKIYEHMRLDRSENVAALAIGGNH